MTTEPEAPLLPILREMIAETGPMPLSRYMAIALGHPIHGYYLAREAIGSAGDFTTAPEVSQMFGEVIGAWLMDMWQRSGAPDDVVLAEAGPGRGTLIADIWRTAKMLPAFRNAARIALVETSPRLRHLQEQALGDAAGQITWHDTLEDLPDGPLLLVANEFMDALPIRQFAHRDGQWHEILVGLNADGHLTPTLSPLPAPEHLAAVLPAMAADGDHAEINEAAMAATDTIARRIAQSGIAALIVDYGYRSGHGDTFQAVRDHKFCDPFAAPGRADLTAHVDFAALTRAAQPSGAAVHGPTHQGPFLDTIGLAHRAIALSGDPHQADSVRAARRRLTHQDEMGHLFKALAITPANGPEPAGFPQQSGQETGTADG